jgi:hypothetical protein
MKFGIYIITTETISTKYLKNPLHQSVCLCVPLGNGSVNTFPLQWIHATIEKLLDESFSTRSVSCQETVWFFKILITMRQTVRHHDPQTNTIWILSSLNTKTHSWLWVNWHLTGIIIFCIDSALNSGSCSIFRLATPKFSTWINCFGLNKLYYISSVSSFAIARNTHCML